MSPRCAVHGADPAVTRCESCGNGLCEACFRFVVRGPRCVRCAHELATRARRRTALGVFVALFSLAMAVLLWLRERTFTWHALALLTGTLGLLLGIWVARTGRDVDAEQLRARLPGERALLFAQAPRRRAALTRRAVSALAPPLSGRDTALSLLIAMTFTAATFPALLRLPTWLEVEVVLGVWWLLSTGLFARLLHRGFALEDDHFFLAPRPPAGLSKLADGGWDPGCADLAGCDDAVTLWLVVFGALLSLLAAFVLAWLLVEVLLPFAFLSFYLVIMAALRRVARDRHDCRGRPALALGWGAIWASAYLVPVGVVVFGFRALLRHGP